MLVTFSLEEQTVQRTWYQKMIMEILVLLVSLGSSLPLLHSWTHCLLGQVTFEWKHTFFGSNDERALVLPLQPAVTIYEVSHVLGLCQRGGFDGQGLQGRDQPRMRPQSLG